MTAYIYYEVSAELHNPLLSNLHQIHSQQESGKRKSLLRKHTIADKQGREEHPCHVFIVGHEIHADCLVHHALAKVLMVVNTAEGENLTASPTFIFPFFVNTKE